MLSGITRCGVGSVEGGVELSLRLSGGHHLRLWRNGLTVLLVGHVLLHDHLLLHVRVVLLELLGLHTEHHARLRLVLRLHSVPSWRVYAGLRQHLLVAIGELVGNLLGEELLLLRSRHVAEAGEPGAFEVNHAGPFAFVLDLEPVV